MGQLNYTTAEVNDAARKTLTPYNWITYLPDGSPYTTPSITANTPTKILIPTTVKYSNGWALFDKGGGDFAVQFQGTGTRKFEIDMSTSMRTGTNNVVFDIQMRKNGIIEQGIAIERKIGTGADVGAISAGGQFEASPLDYIEIYIIVDLTSTVIFSLTSIRINEVN